MADTKDFDIIRVARSDGADTGPGYWPSTALPPANAAKKTGKEAVAPRTKAQMVRLDEDDPRFVEWRIKLGILLKQELAPHPDEGNAWYVHFPRGYWLYEKSKHLWVSGYPVKAKLFKTPQEFGLHLLWLLSTSMDYMDCCCIHCNVPNLSKTCFMADGTPALLASAAPLKMLGLPPKVSPVPLPTIPGQPQPRQPPLNGPGPQITPNSQGLTDNAPAEQSSAAKVMSLHPGQQRAQGQAETQAQARSAVQSQAKSQLETRQQDTRPEMQAEQSSAAKVMSLHPGQQRAQGQAETQAQARSAVQSQAKSQLETRQQDTRPEMQGRQEALAEGKPKPPPASEIQPQSQPRAPSDSRLEGQLADRPVEKRAQGQPPAPARAVKWALQAPLLFRAGELVWYQNGNSWRLGVIAGPGTDNFQLIPIGHAAARQQNVTKSAKEMRPFHAFSVPGVMLPDLQNKVFDQVAWQDLFLAAGQDRARRNNLILDASKMAASKIDASYSLWCPLAEDANAETASYYGCFFGAERIEVGDCVRVKPLVGDAAAGGQGGGGGNGNSNAESSVLGLTAIVARKPSPGAILFRGTMYQIAKQQQGAADAATVPAEKLPLALRDETEWRLRASPGQQPWRWVLVKEDIVLDEQAVKGRFYPPHRLMPILNEAAFNAAVATGNVESQYPFLNNRMDGSGGYIGVKSCRRHILGASVPDDVGIILEPLIREVPSSGPGQPFAPGPG
ncbi:hypothetical protein L249_8914 [Ophiocordyceps polyrhachis-furcata BCC 54312]|uniref:Cryptic loci regulator 2 C-terminal domain-containing protein n=1 Tax=Ophiocordyceps polyrhachis-furcata BCC 54312 TaxID=1330021 RepID=A0A367L1M7_9HYPO|nr:hypothetical protein L249_8914 [Ophiocordyceps polyrhachis-furcata BCC 54312]